MYTSSLLPAESVVAIEAAPRSFKRLAENAELNGDRWRCLYAALWNVGEETLTIHASNRFHASGTVVDRLAMYDSATSEVRTVTIDDVVSQYANDPDREIVIKLDVEGAELQAIEGAAETLKGRAWHLIYEDHAKDPTHAVTRFLIEDLGLDIQAIAADGTFVPVASLEMLDHIKQDPRKGYNFVASADDLARRLA
jgi:FkbM family methyltransferase